MKLLLCLMGGTLSAIPVLIIARYRGHWGFFGWALALTLCPFVVGLWCYGRGHCTFLKGPLREAKTPVLVTLAFSIIIIALGGWVWHDFDVRRAESFCERRLIPQLNEFRGKHGSYPERLDQIGYSDKELPFLFDGYTGGGDEFSFLLRGDGWETSYRFDNVLARWQHRVKAYCE